MDRAQPRRKVSPSRVRKKKTRKVRADTRTTSLLLVPTTITTAANTRREAGQEVRTSTRDITEKVGVKKA